MWTSSHGGTAHGSGSVAVGGGVTVGPTSATGVGEMAVGRSAQRASNVLPWLWVGSEADACDIVWLKQTGVKSVLTAAVECSPPLDPTTIGQHGVEHHLALPMQDAGNEQFELLLTQAVSFLADAKARGDVVFAHCRAGVSRSPTVVIAYLMQHEGWTLEAAMAHVKRYELFFLLF